MTPDIAIQVRGLTKAFDSRVVVDDLSLSVPGGRIMGFLGPNGSGKTTTIRMLCGLLTPDGGGGTCLGLDIVTQAHAIKRQVGYMTQRFSFYEDLSILENLDFVARIYGIDDRKRRIAESLERLGLAERRKQLAGELSGGWKQRLALAACILHQPRLLLLDEPTAGVDPKARREFWEQIHTLAADGLTVLVSTHYMDEAERCHEIAYIAYGKLLATGTVEQVVAGAGLTTFTAQPNAPGALVTDLARQLAGLPGVELIAPFGAALHVGGADRAALTASLAPFLTGRGFAWNEDVATLEDVFIHLMGRSRDNFGRGGAE
ncbi:multidrug ABC transporter ATP-binding protein [Paramagnetospirillum marisnigri]|uniref:Multidrug ABC transporter ATP-binding protein n=1 Tax=Paramagnetospirillum marisnigri TaxID=1285242 RepID=A0A178MQ43_9PROT|nr:ABC transporter ATP-binding protein [Paramagnetospirillum marisnigri]OAN50731.1 multidrug ABC transporter ATP-binding protein [Paramagnetospirillum marisnigri]